jgi:hypothetical protein
LGFVFVLLFCWHLRAFALASACFCAGIRVLLRWHPRAFALASAFF